MHWTDEGYLLSKNNYTENSIIIETFTLNHGKCSGIIFGASSKKIKNIIENKKRYDNELLFNYFRAQVDNSLRLGWKKEDIIIGTNFDFEHNGVKNIELKNICTSNVFNNKWYGIQELMSSGKLNDDFWFHDQDSWQVNEVNFPDKANRPKPEA